MVRGWRYVTTLGDVLDLSARWMEGEGAFHPQLGAHPAGHVIETAPFLAGATRAGWLIHGYQPGVTSPEVVQRSYLDGYCRRDLSTWIRNAGLDLDLHVEVRNPGLVARPTTDATVSSGRVLARVGGRPHPDDLLIYASAGVPAGVVDEIAGMAFVTVVDLEWGRTDRIETLLGRISEIFSDRFTGRRAEEPRGQIGRRRWPEESWADNRRWEPVIPNRLGRRDADTETQWSDQSWGRAG
jgi:hypothetical protein